MVSIALGSQTAYNIGDVVVHPLFDRTPGMVAGHRHGSREGRTGARPFFARRSCREGALVFGHHLVRFPISGGS